MEGFRVLRFSGDTWIWLERVLRYYGFWTEAKRVRPDLRFGGAGWLLPRTVLVVVGKDSETWEILGWAVGGATKWRGWTGFEEKRRALGRNCVWEELWGDAGIFRKDFDLRVCSGTRVRG